MNKSADIAKTVTVNLLRFALALVFAFSGFVKAADPMGTVHKLTEYADVLGLTPHPALLMVGAWVLIGVEYVMGVCLLFGLYRRFYLTMMTAFLAVATPFTLWVALTNPVSDCGCFGDAIVLTNWQTFWKNVILILLAILLIALRKSVRELWQAWMEGVIAIVTILLAIAFMAWTKNHLPIKDFRPYKIGNHLPTLMEYPEDAEQDQYEISLVYAQNGVEQTFTIENYPKGDSTWTYVRTDSKLIKKGYEPPIHDLEIVNAEGEDLTWDILESEEPVTLVVMYDLQKADKKQMDKVMRLLGDEVMSQAVSNVAIGSTTPDNAPIAKALLLFIPSAYSGKDNIAPSGRFCNAIPIDNAHAADIDIAEPSAIAEPNNTPTAMPSGILCNVTATDNIVVRCHCLRCGKPSGLSAPICKCGISVSNNNRNSIPATKPIAAGIHSLPPDSTDISIAGKINDHILAATITPEAKPNSVLWAIGDDAIRR